MRNTVEETALWVRRFHPKPDARVRLVVLAHAGGSASYFFPMSRAMDPAIEILAIQYPGRQDRRFEPCVANIGELAGLIDEAVLPWCDRPVALFGHSMGALVGFELARRMAADRREPLGLVVSGHRAPALHRGKARHLHDDNVLVAELAELNGTGRRLLDDDEQLQMMLPVVRSDYKAVDSYRYRPGAPLGCPILAMVGDSDPVAAVDEVRAWAKHTSASFEFTVFPGGHFFLSDRIHDVARSVSNIVDKWSPLGETRI